MRLQWRDGLGRSSGRRPMRATLPAS